MNRKPAQAPPIAVRRLMLKHGLSEPSARLYAQHIYGGAAPYGR